MKRNHFLFLLVWLPVFLHAHPIRYQWSLNYGWRFHKGDAPGAEQPGFNDASWRTVNLPHDWSIEGPFSKEWASGTGYSPGGIGWYRQTFDYGIEMPGKLVYIYFDGVYKNSEVWINGHYLGKRPNGFIPFQYELTKYLQPGKNTIAVKVDHTDFADSRWYTGSGIYRDVTLIITDPVHIDQWGVAFSTPMVSTASATANVKVTVVNSSKIKKSITVQCNLFRRPDEIAGKAQKTITITPNATTVVDCSFTIANPKLWSIDTPDIYNLRVELLSAGKVIDNWTTVAGIRSIRFDAAKGFFLNGVPTKLQGVCIHDDAGVFGVAVPEEVWIRRLNTLKQGGCNALRLSHNPHADYLYRLCDLIGFVVMDEAFDEWEVGKNKWIQGWNKGTPGKDGYHTYFKEWSDRDLRDMILRNRNHP